MRYSTSNFLKTTLASAACAATAICATLPASANPHARSTRTAAPARAHYAAPARAHYAAPARVHYAAPARVHYAAPARAHYAAPARVHYAAPARVHYAAPARVHYAAPAHAHYAAPARAHYAAPARVHYAAPARVHYAAPARAHYAAPARTHYAAPARTHYAAPARVHYAAPARVQYAAPARVHYAAPARAREEAPFVQRVAPKRTVHTVTRTAPFMQYVRTAPRTREKTVTRAVVASPLVRAAYVARSRTIPVVYHPRYIVGRVAAIRSNEMIVDPPTGEPVAVRDIVVGSAMPAVGTIVTLPVTYADGMYRYAAPAYSSYPAYGYGTYAPQYGYAYAPPVYCNGSSSTALYAALIPAVVGLLSGNGNVDGSALAPLALEAAAGGANDCVSPGYAAPVNYGYSTPVAPAAYSVPVATYGNYATPYDNCMYSDDDGDDNGCATASPYTYNAYSNYSQYAAYAPQQVQGVVVARSGDMLMVLGANGTPTFVYAAPALQNGFTNGPIQPGAIVDAYGYYSGNTFVATTLV